MDLSNVDLIKLQSRVMRNDNDVIGFSASLSDQIRKLASETNRAQIYGYVDRLPEEALDILAWQFNADWYDANSDIDTKRQAIKDVLHLARIRGTPAAVQRLVEIYFGDGEVEEWFNYGGAPYHFRVVTSNEKAIQENAQFFFRAVNSAKNLRSRLESVIIRARGEIDMHMGLAIHTTDKLRLTTITSMPWSDLSGRSWNDLPDNNNWLNL